MIEAIHKFFNRNKKEAKWEDNIFIPIKKTIEPKERVSFNEVFSNTIKK